MPKVPSSSASPSRLYTTNQTIGLGAKVIPLIVGIIHVRITIPEGVRAPVGIGGTIGTATLAHHANVMTKNLHHGAMDAAAGEAAAMAAAMGAAMGAAGAAAEVEAATNVRNGQPVLLKWD